jgi:hypothetical protein
MSSLIFLFSNETSLLIGCERDECFYVTAVWNSNKPAGVSYDEILLRFMTMVQCTSIWYIRSDVSVILSSSAIWWMVFIVQIDFNTSHFSVDGLNRKRDLLNIKLVRYPLVHSLTYSMAYRLPFLGIWWSRDNMLLRDSNIYYFVHKIQVSNPTLSQLNPFHIFRKHFHTIYLNVILMRTSGSHKLYIFSGFQIKALYAFLVSVC